MTIKPTTHALGDLVHFPADHKDVNCDLSPFAGLSGRVIANWGPTKSGLNLLVRIDDCTHQDLVQRYHAHRLRSEFPGGYTVTLDDVREWHGIDGEVLADPLSPSDSLPPSAVLVEADSATLTDVGVRQVLQQCSDIIESLVDGGLCTREIDCDCGGCHFEDALQNIGTLLNPEVA